MTPTAQQVFRCRISPFLHVHVRLSCGHFMNIERGRFRLLTKKHGTYRFPRKCGQSDCETNR